MSLVDIVCGSVGIGSLLFSLACKLELVIIINVVLLRGSPFLPCEKNGAKRFFLLHTMLFLPIFPCVVIHVFLTRTLCFSWVCGLYIPLEIWLEQEYSLNLHLRCIYIKPKPFIYRDKLGEQGLIEQIFWGHLTGRHFVGSDKGKPKCESVFSYRMPNS